MDDLENATRHSRQRLREITAELDALVTKLESITANLSRTRDADPPTRAKSQQELAALLADLAGASAALAEQAQHLDQLLKDREPEQRALRSPEGSDSGPHGLP